MSLRILERCFRRHNGVSGWSATVALLFCSALSAQNWNCAGTACTTTSSVGIGSSSAPRSLLDVNGGDLTLSSGQALRFMPGGAYVRSPASTAHLMMGWGGGDTFYLNGGNGQITIGGTHYPAGPALTVLGASGQTANIFQLYNSGGTPLFNVGPGGNVGIGTSSPATALDVRGQINAQYGINTQGWTYTPDGIWGTGGSGVTPIRFSMNCCNSGGVLIGFSDNGNGTYIPSIGFSLSNGHQADADQVSILQSRYALDNELSNRFQIRASGTLGWGPGVSATDTTLGRFQPGGLHLLSSGQTTLFIDAAPANQAVLAFNGTQQGTVGWQLMRTNTNSLVFWNQAVGSFLNLNPNGTVGIGTSLNQYPLAVKGTVAAGEVLVTSTSGWPDYIFGVNHRLQPLREVAEYVKENGHLPDIPSAAEVAEKGVAVGEMQAKLLAKIEELTLHEIETNERMDRLEEENRQLRAEMERSGK